MIWGVPVCGKGIERKRREEARNEENRVLATSGHPRHYEHVYEQRLRTAVTLLGQEPTTSGRKSNSFIRCLPVIRRKTVHDSLRHAHYLYC